MKTRHAPVASVAGPRKRPAYSLIRFSTPQQALGDSRRRQYDRTVAYCEANGLELVETIRDEGLSGYHGVHRKRGAFGRFVKRFEAGEVPSGGVFIAEAFDRMDRQVPRKAQELFLRLINGGLDVVTLIDGKRYSAASIDANIGDLFMSIGLMLGAHAESKNKADRIRETWIGRHNGGIGKATGMSSNIFPAWIDKTRAGPAKNTAKVKIIVRIFKLALIMGVEQIAKLLNEEGVPTLNSRKRQRGAPLWDKTTIQKLIRGRQVLGEQPIGRYVDNKRELTGDVIKDAYPAAITEAEWYAANHALDDRKHGVATGRNAVEYVNLFGPLARCSVCGGQMKIRGRGRLNGKKYLGCSNSGLHGCEHTKYYRLDRFENVILEVCGKLAYGDDTPATDETAVLVDEIAEAKVESAALEARYKGAFEEIIGTPPGSLERRAADDIKQRYNATLTRIRELERRYAATVTVKPSFDSGQQLIARLTRLSGPELIAARGRIASGLRQMIRIIRFTPEGNGGAVLEFASGMKLDRRWDRIALEIDAQTGAIALRYTPTIRSLKSIRWTPRQRDDRTMSRA